MANYTRAMEMILGHWRIRGLDVIVRLGHGEHAMEGMIYPTDGPGPTLRGPVPFFASTFLELEEKCERALEEHLKQLAEG